MVTVGAEQTIQNLKNEILDLNDRISNLNNEIEKHKKEIKKVKELYAVKKTDQEISKGQKMVLLHFLGTLDSINEKIPVAANKIKLLRFFIDAHPKNIEKDFNGRSNKIDSPLSTLSNYNFLANLFEEYGMEEEKQSALKTIQDIKLYKKKKK